MAKIAIIGPYEYFGEEELITGEKRKFTVANKKLILLKRWQQIHLMQVYELSKKK